MGDVAGGPRVVLVVPTFPKASETFVASKFAGLRRRGWDVHVACGSSPAAEWARYPELAADADLRARVHVVVPHAPRWKGVVAAPVALGRALAAAPAAVGRHVRALPGGPPARLGQLLLDAHIISLEPDLVHFEFGSLAPQRLHLAAAGITLTTSFRGYDLNDVAQDDPHHYDATWPALTRIHVLGEHLWQRAVDRGCPPDAAHEVINPAVDLGRFTPPERVAVGAGSAERPLRIVSVGRADWTKGYEYGLGAIADLRDRGVVVEARICGHGAMFEAVAFARHQYGLDDCVELLGATDAAEVVEQLAWADVFLHAAVQEAFGNAVIEAQAMALPVVCTDAGGLPENVDPGVTGLVAPRRDPAALADALAELAGDPDRRLAMGRAGRQRAEQHFDLDDQLDRWEGFYRSALPVASAR